MDPVSARARPEVDLAGAVLGGSYRLVRIVGFGGMGAVYEAVQLRLNKRVAVKLMSRELASNMVSLARFHREAEITSQLGHPHLVNVIDFGTADTGEPYLVMEYLDGEDLEQRLQKAGRLSIHAAVQITRQVASALGAAHAQEIVHRDLKPANIFLLQVPGEPEFVKVLDFGISKVKAARARLTRATSVVGTPYYMSPEQATGRFDDTDHRADQWALACIAWEMLSGHTPFEADDTTAVFYQITHVAPPSLVKQVPGLTSDAEHVLRRALNKRFDKRFPSIRDFARAFELAAFGQCVDETPAPVAVPHIPAAQTRKSHSLVHAVLGLVTPHGPEGARAVTELAAGTAGQGEIFQNTYEIKVDRRPLWRRPVSLIAGAAAIVLLGVGLYLLGSSGAGTKPAAAHSPPAFAPTAAATPSAGHGSPEWASSSSPIVRPIQVAPLRPSPPSASPNTPGANEPARTRSLSRSKPARGADSRRAQGEGRRRPARRRPLRPRIFEEL